MKKFRYWNRTEEVNILQEAIDWAMECACIHSMAEAVEWAIAEYRWNLADEDSVDGKAIQRKVDILVAIRSRMK